MCMVLKNLKYHAQQKGLIFFKVKSVISFCSSVKQFDVLWLVFFCIYLKSSKNCVIFQGSQCSYALVLLSDQAFVSNYLL